MVAATPVRSGKPCGRLSASGRMGETATGRLGEKSFGREALIRI